MSGYGSGDNANGKTESAVRHRAAKLLKTADRIETDVEPAAGVAVEARNGFEAHESAAESAVSDGNLSEPGELKTDNKPVSKTDSKPVIKPAGKSGSSKTKTTRKSKGSGHA